MQYRLAAESDLDEICNLVKKAIDRMEQQGIYQWDDLYPTRKDFLEDINKNTLYVAVEDGRIAAIYVINRISCMPMEQFG